MAIQGLFYIHIQVVDLARSKAFYGETLGWKLGTDERDVAGLGFGSGYLVITLGEHIGSGGVEVCVSVDDLEAQHQRLTQNHVEPTPIETKPWGERSFCFKDPDGYAWRYGQSV